MEKSKQDTDGSHSRNISRRSANDLGSQNFFFASSLSHLTTKSLTTNTTPPIFWSTCITSRFIHDMIYITFISIWKKVLLISPQVKIWFLELHHITRLKECSYLFTCCLLPLVKLLQVVMPLLLQMPEKKFSENLLLPPFTRFPLALHTNQQNNNSNLTYINNQIDQDA